MKAMNRKDFLQCASAGLIALGSISFGYSWLRMGNEYTLRSKYKPEFSSRISSDEMNIVYLATLAPSGHNTQPWVIEWVAPNHWIIGSDRSRWLPAVDSENRELFLSIGAFIENLTVAAGIYGYSADIVILCNNKYDTKIAEVKLKPVQSNRVLADRIIARRTIRSNYSKKELLATDVNYLIGDNQDQITYYPASSRPGQYLAEETIRANKAQVFRETAQRELAEWIRWSANDAKTYGNGLTPESMELQGLVRWYTTYFFTRQMTLENQFREATIKKVEEQVRTCGGWLVVSSKNTGIADLLEAGGLLQRAWLKARDKLIGFHPMTQMLEEVPWKVTIASELEHGDTIQFVIRVGYVPHYPQPVSLRMPLSKTFVG